MRVRIAPREWWKSPIALIFGGQATGSCDHFKYLLGRGDEQDHIYLGTAPAIYATYLGPLNSQLV